MSVVSVCLVNPDDSRRDIWKEVPCIMTWRAPGLAVTSEIGIGNRLMSGRWVITHVRSGRVAAGSPDLTRAETVELMRRIGHLVPWMESLDALATRSRRMNPLPLETIERERRGILDARAPIKREPGSRDAPSQTNSEAQGRSEA